MDRLKEPSTWAGVAALLQAAKFIFPQWAVMMDGLSAAAGSMAIAMREKSGN